MADKFTFEADLEWNDVITEDVEQQISEYAKKELGRTISRDDIEDYTIKLTVEVSLFD